MSAYRPSFRTSNPPQESVETSLEDLEAVSVANKYVNLSVSRKIHDLLSVHYNRKSAESGPGEGEQAGFDCGLTTGTGKM